LFPPNFYARSDLSYNYVSQAIDKLALNPQNKDDIIFWLVSSVNSISQRIISDLQQLKETIEPYLKLQSLSPARLLVVVSQYNSSHYETSLLRILKSVNSLLPSTNAEIFKTLLRNLDPLWDALQSCLSLFAVLSQLSAGSSSGSSGSSGPSSSSASLTTSSQSLRSSSGTIGVGAEQPTTTTAFGLLLPLIEAFFVSYSKFITPETAEMQKNDVNLQSVEHFISFLEKYRYALNDLLRQTPSLLLKGSFALLANFPKILDFDNKRTYFKAELQKQKTEMYHRGLIGSSIRLSIRRAHVFEDAYHQLRNRTKDEMRDKLTIHFVGEEGIDAGGLLREFYSILARAMFNPHYALFTPTSSGTFQPNRSSNIIVDHLSYFSFVGRMIAKSLLDGILLDSHFTRSLYKHMLGKAVHYSDMEAVDPEYYKNLLWILENNISDVLDLSFAAEAEEFGKMKIQDLKENGRNIPVTEENKQEYVQLITEHRMTKGIEEQINAFLKGFYELVPKNLIQIFNEKELELLISGMPEIDIVDMKSNTEYVGYQSTDQTIQWFWEIVGSLSTEERALLVQFVTGTSKVPLDGFQSLQGISGPQKFQIHRSYRKDRLPTAHTCKTTSACGYGVKN
jgi:E3 ubiquitin-protein ligase HUWE1